MSWDDNDNENGGMIMKTLKNVDMKSNKISKLKQLQGKIKS